MISGSLHYLLTVYTSLINQIISEHSANHRRVTYISIAPENWSCSLFVLSTKVIVWMLLMKDRVWSTWKKQGKSKDFSHSTWAPSSDSLHRLTQTGTCCTREYTRAEKAAETISINETIYCQLNLCQTRMQGTWLTLLFAPGSYWYFIWPTERLHKQAGHQALNK